MNVDGLWGIKYAMADPEETEGVDLGGYSSLPLPQELYVD